MAFKTTLEQLEELQLAISNVLEGQTYTYKGRTVALPDLQFLQRREVYLENKYKLEQHRKRPYMPTHGSFS